MSHFSPIREILAGFGGRLTLSSGVPVTTSNVNSATAIHLTPFTGRHIAIYDGNAFQLYQFAELTLTLNDPNHAASSVYDVFGFLNAGAVTIGTGPAWSSGISRGTGAGTTELTRVHGLLVNAVQITARNGATTYTVAANRGVYLGSSRMRGTNGQTDDSESMRHLWNNFNRRLRSVAVSEATASWNHSTASFQQANAASGNKVEFLRGLNEDAARFHVSGTVSSSGATGRNTAVGIGIDSTTVNSATNATLATASTAVNGMPTADYDGYPGLGYHYAAWLEYGGGADTQTWFGGTGSPHKNGLTGAVWA